MRAFDAGGIQNCHSIGRHQRNGIRPRWNIATSDATVVEDQGPVTRRQKRPRPVPHLGWVSQSHDEQNRLTLALLIPINLGSLILDERHQCSRSECQQQAELDLAFRKGGSESQRHARRSRPATRKGGARSNSMHVERREPRDQAKDRAYFVIYAGKICPVCEVESFCGDLQVSPLAYFVPPTQAHVEVDIVGAQTCVARRSDGTF